MRANELYERIILLEASAKSSHCRIDELKESQEQILKELKEYAAILNQARGWLAASIALGGAFGGIVSKVLDHFLKT